MNFPVSGVSTPVWLPPLVGFGISFFTSMGGVSGAVLILPFQVSVLGFSSPAVTPTNLVFNIVGIPGGVYRYFREGRMNWPLAWNIILGTLPGLFLGGAIRVLYLPDPRAFKLFAGCVLLYLGGRMLLQEAWGRVPGQEAARRLEARLQADLSGPDSPGIASGRAGDAVVAVPAAAGDAPVRALEGGGAAATAGPGAPLAIRVRHWSLRRTEYEFHGQRFAFSTVGLFLLSLAVGLVGGVYGIGGGAIIAPFIVSFFGLPVHTIAGATLLGTCVTSVGGVLFFQFLAPLFAPAAMPVAPDWALGSLFGLGGLLGMYLGAGLQKRVSGRLIRPLLALVVGGVGLQYVAGYFF